MGTKNAAMFAALHRDNLNTAKESIIFGIAKKKQRISPTCDSSISALGQICTEKPLLIL